MGICKRTQGRRRPQMLISRLHITSELPIALLTDGAESLLRLGAFLPVPTRFVLDYLHASMKLRHLEQCIDALTQCQGWQSR